MADHPTDPKFEVKVNLNCCKACPEKLEKALLKLEGISSLTIYLEKNLVSISGTVHPDTIITLISAELSKNAKLVSYQPPSTKADEVKPKNTDTEKDKDLKSRHKGKMHKSCCCQCHDKNCPKMVNNEHKCEKYGGPPEVKDFICRDYFCKIHPRSRKITDTVPENESSGRLYGYMPNYGEMYNYGGRNPRYPIRGSYYPQWYPERAPAQYEYYQPPRGPPPSYGFY